MTNIVPEAAYVQPRMLSGPDDQIRTRFNAVDWDFRSFVPNPRMSSVHGLHWYPAAFPPALVGTVLDLLGHRGAVVLDPFCGAAAVPVEAWSRGMEAYGFDSNRFVVEIARAKVDLIARGTSASAAALLSDYRAFRNRVFHVWEDIDGPSICFRANIHRDASRWFTDQVLREIAIIKSWAASEGDIVPPWRRVVLIALSAILHGRLSVVRNYHYTYVVDRSRVDQECRDRTDVSQIFSEKVSAIFVDAELQRERITRAGIALSQASPPTLGSGRAQELGRHLQREVDLVITSPPYFGMNDYVRSQYLSWLVLQWDGFDVDLGNEIGSRRVRRNPRARDAYYENLELCFHAIREVLRPAGRLALVIGSSEGQFVNGTDPVTQLREMISRQGFQLEWEGSRRVRFRKINNTPYRTELLWVLRKPEVRLC